MNSNLTIRILESSTDMQLVYDLEKTVWEGEAIPAHQTITAASNGGLVLGAFIKEKLVGFSYSFPGFHDGQIYLCSHNLGIHPDYQELGIGSKLKAKQKQLAYEMGYKLISWTFDPLESRNAYLNLSKLRAICHTYVKNCYGDVEDGLNKGLPTDRFKVEWWIDSEHVLTSPKEILTHPHFTYPWEITDDYLPKLGNVDEHTFQAAMNSQPILIPVPAKFQELKGKNAELAIEWRLKTREIFQSLFEHGYTAIQIEKTNSDPIHYYVLVNRNSLQIGSIQFSKKK